MSKPSSDRAAISRIIDGLIERGCTPILSRNGANEDLPYTDKESALKWLTSCDDSVLYVRLPELTSDEAEELRNLEVSFEAAGGRGVEDADRIDHLRRRRDGKDSFIYFVLGNAPEEVAADWSVSVSPYLDPIVNPWWE